MSSIEDRAVGTLVGLACGDAVGTTLESRPPGSFYPIDDMVGGGPFDLKPGQWTDDTAMALCLGESILDTGSMDLSDQHRRYRLWRDDGYMSSTGVCFSIGATTARQLARAERTGKAIDPDVDEEAAANGSLMRLASVPIRGYFDRDTVGHHCAMSSRTTHPARRPVDACRTLGSLIADLIAVPARGPDELGPRLGALTDRVASRSRVHPQIEAVVRGSFLKKHPADIRGTGFVVDALEAALWAVSGADFFAEAILRAANLGDDADTTAAIAGQVAGALWGVGAIPHGWLDRLAMGDRIRSIATGLVYAAHDAVPTIWPFDHLVHGWRVAPDFLAGEYPGSSDDEQANLKLNVLVDAGVRTFIDLTTHTEGLPPYAPLLDAIADARRLDLRRWDFPIPDMGTLDESGYRAIEDAIDAERSAGRQVFVHCWGGMGRTGTVVGRQLVANGITAQSALDRLVQLRSQSRKAHLRAPQTDRQVAAVARRER